MKPLRVAHANYLFRWLDETVVPALDCKGPVLPRRQIAGFLAALEATRLQRTTVLALEHSERPVQIMPRSRQETSW